MMDPFKLLAQSEGRKTAHNLRGTSMKEVPGTRGESAFILEYKHAYLAFVQEGLGTKSLVANAMRSFTGKTYYENLAYDTVATMVNDLITVGARPTTILAYWSAGNPTWYEDKKRMHDLILGWAKACDASGAVWGGGETQTSQGIVAPDAIDLAGSCFGIISPKSRITVGNKLKTGDEIILLESSGIHTNGLTLARKLSEKLPTGYTAKISDGKSYGQALLTPSIIYAKLIDDLYENQANIHYMTHITGHGWRKIMRHPSSFTYRIHQVPPVPAVLQFIIEQAKMSEKEAYSAFNMGAGFAIFVPEKDTAQVVKIAKNHKIKAYISGVVEKGPKQVIIEPKNIIFEGKSLQVRV